MGCEREALRSEAQHDVNVSADYFVCKHSHWQRRRWKDASRHGQSRHWPISLPPLPPWTSVFLTGSFSEIDTPAASDLHGFAAPCYDLHLGLSHAWLAVRNGAHRETWMFTFLLTRWRTASYFRLLPWCPKPWAFSTGPLWLIACLAWINIHVRLKKWDIKTQRKSLHCSGKGSWLDQSGQKKSVPISKRATGEYIHTCK